MMTFVEFLDKHFNELATVGGSILGIGFMVFVCYGLYRLMKDI